MAITLQKIKKSVNWVPIIVAAVLVIIVIGAAYFLFFAPVPGIEVISPSEQRITSQLSSVKLDTRPVVEVLNSGALKRHAGPPSVGQVGRSNPFISF